ncbi:MAG TPA: transglycosylase domain-containing protein [Nitriliruptorales bacterium]|nr:transglycosylase domain-containing protein [Nitriliruptorales bacterium]
MAVHDPASAREALVGRLVLLLAVVAASAVLVSALFLPSAIALDRVVRGVNQSVLDVPPLPEELRRPPVNSVVVAADGVELAELHAEQSRVLVALRDVPQVTQEAVVATEDGAFFRHHGVNHQAILRAAFANLESGDIEQGGSTITQQYVRNVPGIGISTEQTIERKLKEAVWAVELEQRLSKEEILERYLNTVYFGNGVYGIGTAARHYFAKHVSQLSLSESALLAGLIRAPERNNPRTDLEAALGRRDIVLRQMEAQGFVTAPETKRARQEPLQLAPPTDGTPTRPFFVEWVKSVLYDPSNDLQPELQAALGEDKAERQRNVFEGGLVIHTTLDRARQDMADATIARYLTDPLHDPLASVVTVDPRTGAVPVMTVGPKQFGNCPEGRTPCELTKVIPAVPGGGSSFGREPGSAFKPVIITAALLEGFTPGYATETSSGQLIEGCEARPGEPYKVNNYAGGGGGIMDMYEAVKRSNNVYHVKLARDVGVEAIFDTAGKLGLARIPNRSDYGARSCSIGLGTVGVYPLEMAAAYATLANRGERCEPFVVTKVTDRDGNLVYQHTSRCEQVIDRGIADRVTDIIQGPPTAGGTAPFVRDQLGRPVAGKTGTTDDWTNAWFMGYVPQYATAVWVGYEFPKCVQGMTSQCGSMFGVEAGGTTYAKVTGGTIPARMWADYMQAALEPVPVEGFATAPPIPTARVPRVVGMHQRAAVATLEGKGFKSRAAVVTDWRPAGQVVQQSPGGGSEAWVGSVVTLGVSDGTGERPLPEVPDVVGLQRNQAIRTLTDAGYGVLAVDQGVADPARHGIVVAQRPPAGSPLERGSPVVITVGRYASGEPIDGGRTDDGSGGRGGGGGGAAAGGSGGGGGG